MNQKVHNHGSLVTDPVKDSELVLNSANNNGLDSENVNFSVITPSVSTTSNYSNLSIHNDKNIGFLPMSSARLKSQSRLMSSESM